MRRRAITEIQHDFVNVAPAPPFGGIVTFNNRMTCRMKMPRCVAMRGIIAALDYDTTIKAAVYLAIQSG